MPIREEHRSGCPIHLALEVFGDRWTLLVVRDLMFAGKRHFREILASEEGIASNILADRLNLLVEHEIVTKAEDPTHKQKAIYSLTEKGIDLLPVLVQLGVWSRKYRPARREYTVVAERYEKEGTAYIDELRAELREVHLGVQAGVSAKRSRRR